MVCQICKTRLPFRLDDGNDYFEAVEFLPELSKRHYQNYLALCPNHAAMFQYANSSSACLENHFVNLAVNELGVLLAQKDLTIYFTKTHTADLKEVIRVDRSETNVNQSRGVGERSVPSDFASN
jgi:Rad3-related DNA helicase